MNPRIAVIPAAGYGTRMLPWSSAVPKEMLPIGTFPAIHYVLCELAASGIETVVIVNSAWKTALDNYFNPDPDLLRKLEADGKLAALESLLMLREKLELVSIRQRAALGLGDAVRTARPIVGDAPFAVALPDELMLDRPPVTRELMAASAGGGAVALMDVPADQTHLYGIADLDGPAPARIVGLVEKPPPGTAPTTLAIVGRYVFPAGFMHALDQLRPGTGGELQLTDAMRDNLSEFPLTGVVITGRRYDTGNPDSYAATWKAWLQDPAAFMRAAQPR